MSSTLLKSGAVVSAMTFISRVLGLVRDVVIANLLGAGIAADVFFFANKIPNFLRRLFAEGAFAQAFIPVLTEVKATEDKRYLREFIAKVSGTLGVIVSLTAILGVVGSPVVVALFGAGWFVDYLNDSGDADKFTLAATMLKITFPYLAFISLTGLAGAILNTLNRFAVAAFTPVLLNVAIICCAVLLAPHLDRPVFALAWGVFLGGLAQLFFQLPFLYRAGVLVKPRWGWQDPNVQKVKTLMIPALFGVSVSQLNLLFDTLIASFLMTGSISWLYYSDRLLEFPLGLFGIAIATVILPALSQDHVKRNKKSFAANMDWGVRMVCLLGIPAAVGLIMLAKPMLLVIFARGAFTPDDAQMASYSLIAYATGLLSFMLIKVLAPGFFSRQDTKTPVVFGIWCMAINIILNIFLAIPFGYVGLAMATSFSAALNAILLYHALHKQQVYRLNRATCVFIVKVAMCAAVMALVIWQASATFAISHLMPLSTQVLYLLGMIGLAAGVFVISLICLGLRPQHLKAVSTVG